MTGLYSICMECELVCSYLRTSLIIEEAGDGLGVSDSGRRDSLVPK